MPDKNEKNRGGERAFDDDTDEAIVLPRPVPEVTEDDDEKAADAAFDDQVIDLDEEEVKAESESQPSGRKY